MKIIGGSQPCVPPPWALLQRHLLAELEHAALEFCDRYTHSDGTLRWRSEWPGMDGADDPYEAFWALPLLYVLGGGRQLVDLARRQWDAITWQWTEYGQVHREFDGYYDWMHHGESLTLLYLLGLADPTSPKDRQRAVRFAEFYTGDDESAANYDQTHRLIRSPLNGSRGPRFAASGEDWSTHRENLDTYPTPFEDIPGIDERGRARWSDDDTFAQILRLMNERMTRGDVPLNLTATTLATHAYLHTGQDRFRQWVLEYNSAWTERARDNGGIIPDNVGLDGHIGQYNDGKWWGGYYGWRWPVGGRHILEAVTIAGTNAVLLDGDDKHLELARSQFDALWNLGRDDGDVRLVPHRRIDAGWTDYSVPAPSLPIHCWTTGFADQDLRRVLRIQGDQDWRRPSAHRGKANAEANSAAWFTYLRGENPEYPQRILETNYRQMVDRMTAVRSDDADPTHVDIHHWQDMNPLAVEGLVQTMLGAPLNVYYGGLQHAAVRYFDADEQRPGLPPDVAALVDTVNWDHVALTLVNCSTLRPRTVVVQAGAFGEHEFVRDRRDGTVIGDKWFVVELGPSSQLRLDLEVRRFANQPSYETPWVRRADLPPLLSGRRGVS